MTVRILCLCAGWLAAPLADAGVPPGYPASYAETIESARREGRVVIYSVTDTRAVEPLLRDFRSLYPGLEVEYHDMNSTEAYSRFISESVTGSSADVLWSSAMDLQVKLVSDGYAQPYESPELPHLPSWAVWRNAAFGTTYEPAVFVYNRRLLANEHVPSSHADFTRLLLEHPALFRRKVTTYDAEKSGIGFMLVTQDHQMLPAFWSLARAMGAVKPVLQSSTGTMMERISSGEILVGYNIVGSYALSRARRDPAIGIVMPSDYVLVLSRVAFIAKDAPHPAAARLWVDYLLSRRGQTLLARDALLGSVRGDVEGESSSSTLARELGGRLRPIPVNEELLVYLDARKRLAFLKQWSHAMRPRSQAAWKPAP